MMSIVFGNGPVETFPDDDLVWEYEYLKELEFETDYTSQFIIRTKCNVSVENTVFAASSKAKEKKAEHA